MRIFKYEIPAEDEPTIQLPKGATILSVGAQGEKIFLWALVEPTQKAISEIKLRIVGIGHEICDETRTLHFLGTVHLYRSSLIFHIFEKVPVPFWDPA